MKTEIIGTGLSGLVGTRVTELLQDKYNFEDLSLTTGVDITDLSSLRMRLAKSPASIVLHMAAKADTDSCEKDRDLGETGPAWQINVLGTKNVVASAKETGKKVIFISTDFVFDGTSDFYNEESLPNPINWYGVTKYEAEKLVGKENLILRIGYPYRAKFDLKQDFLHKIIDRLKNHQKLLSPTDMLFTPTFIDDIAYAIDLLISRNADGIYHIFGSSSLSSYEANMLIAHEFGLDKSLIKKTTAFDLFHNRRPQPLKLVLKNDKITELGLTMKTFQEGLQEIKRQLKS